MTVTEITLLPRAGLCALWVDWFSTDPPANISQPVLRRILTYEAQVRTHGRPDRKTRAAITRVQKQIITPTAKPRARTPRLKPGARLMRDWNGKSHIVHVTEQGFEWNGQSYKSLSAIARAITGAHWSGPRFFGLTGGGAHGKA